MAPQRPQHTRRTEKNRNGSHLTDQVPTSALVPLDAARRAKFCQLIEQDACIATACALVGVSRMVVRRAIAEDPEMRAMYEEAMDRFRDQLIRAARHRGVEGVVRPVYFKGKRVPDKKGENREYSDALLIKLLERHIPEFRTKTQVDQRTLSVDLGAVDLRSLSPRQQEKLRELLQETDKQTVEIDAREPPRPPSTEV